jgi:hypothetical protein
MLALLAAAAGSGVARADIYTWVDASGRTNISNLKPPEGATIKSVAVSPPRDPMAEAAAREAARQEVAALRERVQQLEAENEARRQAAMQPAYFPPPQYAPPPQQPGIEVTVMGSEPTYSGCDYSWFGCSGFWPGPIYYTAPYYASPYYARAKNFQRFNHRGNSGRPPSVVPVNPGRPRPTPIPASGFASRAPTNVAGAYPKRQ